MNKLSKSLIMTTVITSLIVPNVLAYDSPSEKIMEKEQKFEQKAENKIQKLHNDIAKHPKKYFSIKADGTLEINAKAKDLQTDEQTLFEYEKAIEIINQGIKLGALKFDANLVPQVITDAPVQTNTQEATVSQPNTISPMAIPDEPPTFALVDKWTANKQEMQTVRKSYFEAAKINPSINVQTATVTYFATRVREGGVWDYKRTLGYTNEYKVFINGTKIYMRGEDIGNVHYGYVGSSIGLTTNDLCTAGGIVQLLTGTSSWAYYDSYWDDPRDTEYIKKGIYWYGKGY